FLSTSSRLHWAGAAALWLAALADPRSLLWSPALALLLLVRGHIYAAPRHLGLALGQALGIPATAAPSHLPLTAGAPPPAPLAWLPLFALALGAGIGALAEDAPGFGLAVGGVLLLFAALGLVRAWALVHGGPALLPGAQAGLVPWGHVAGC